MSASTLTLKIWSNFIPQKPSQTTNAGDAWVIDPDGLIIEPTERVNATSAIGILKIYRDVHPDSLVIHWLFPNIYVGHVVWISQAPLQLTKAQIATVRSVEKQLAKDWEHATRWEFIIVTPPFRCSLGPREIHPFQQSPHCSPRSRSGCRPCAGIARDYRALRPAA